MLNFSNDIGIIEKMDKITWLHAVTIICLRGVWMTGKTVREIIDNMTVIDDTFLHELGTVKK